MRKNFFALLIVWAFALSGAIAVTAQTTGARKAIIQNGGLVSKLPISDGAMTVNVQKALNESLPQALAGNQAMLAEVLRHLDDVKAKTGVDFRQFQEIAVGLSARKNAAQETEFEPIILARGTFDANAAAALAKNVPNANYREEKIGSRTVYVLTPKQMPSTPTLSVGSSSMAQRVIGNTVNKFFAGLSREIAVTVFDGNTLAIGTMSRLREMFGANARLGADVLALVKRRPNAVMSFGLKLPEGLEPFVSLGDDDLGKNLNSIRFMAGAVDFTDGSGTVSILAKTTDVTAAKGLQEQLEGFKNLGQIFLGSAKGADKQVYARMIENVKIVQNLTNVTLDLQIPQSDINILLNKTGTGASAAK